MSNKQHQWEVHKYTDHAPHMGSIIRQGESDTIEEAKEAALDAIVKSRYEWQMEPESSRLTEDQIREQLKANIVTNTGVGHHKWIEDRYIIKPGQFYAVRYET